jgi:membrane protein implicated in regulation of membrane protease activity
VDDVAADVQQVAFGRAWAVYTGLRFVVFAGTAAALFLVLRLNGLPLLLVALLVSSLASLFLLRSQRERVVLAQQQRLTARQRERAQLRERLDGDPER